MVEQATLELGAILVAVAFLPPIVYAIWIRNVERHNREPWGGVLRVFLYGAFWSVLIAILLEALFQGHFRREYTLGPSGQSYVVSREILLAVVAAPLVEEFTKGLGVRSARHRILELEDGIIYGAAAGLGFSASENLLYELSALTENPTYTALAVGLVRSITSTFLHATASGIVGYGMARRYLHRGMLIEVLPFYAMAVLLHASFNGLAAFVQLNDVPVGGMLLIFFVSIFAIRWTVGRIRRLDRAGVPVYSSYER